MHDVDFQIFLLKSLAANAPVLRDWGYAPPKIVTVIVPEGKSNSFLNYVKGPNSHQITEFSLEKRIQQSLTRSYSSPVLVSCTNSTRTAELIKLLFEFGKLESIDGEKVESIPLVITESRIPMDAACQFQFFVILEDFDKFSESMNAVNVIPKETDLSLIQDIISQQLEDDVESEMEKALIAAACFLYPSIGRVQLARCKEVIKQMINSDDEFKAFDGLSEFFQDSLNKYQARESFTKIYLCDDVEDSIQEIKDTAIFYTDEQFFMSDKLFKKIVEPLVKNGIPVDALKASLVEEKMLIPHRDSSTYVVKVTLKGEEEIRRVRLLRFDRNKFKSTGSRDVIDKIITRKEKQN